jgi:hypothetical protein
MLITSPPISLVFLLVFLLLVLVLPLALSPHQTASPLPPCSPLPTLLLVSCSLPTNVFLKLSHAEHNHHYPLLTRLPPLPLDLSLPLPSLPQQQHRNLKLTSYGLTLLSIMSSPSLKPKTILISTLLTLLLPNTTLTLTLFVSQAPKVALLVPSLPVVALVVLLMPLPLPLVLTHDS